MAQQKKHGSWSLILGLLGALIECRVVLVFFFKQYPLIPLIKNDLFQLILIPANLNFKKSK